MARKVIKRPKSSVMGRPKSEVIKSEKICFLVTPEEFAILEEKVVSSGISRSNYVYMLAKKYGLFDRNEKTSVNL